MPWVNPPRTAPEFEGAPGVWLHSTPLSLSEMRGRVVLVDFFDHSCGNCVATRPHIAAWMGRYAGLGLVTVGIHTPEFPSGKDPRVVTRSLDRLHVDWPVFLDNDYVVWERYANRYWPTIYLIDRSGHLRYTHVGEGAYPETENAIRRLLGEPTP